MSINNSQFVWPTSFACTMVSENKILPNSYSLNISIVPIDESASNIGLGYRKLKYFVEEFLHNSILVHSENPLAKLLEASNTNLVLLPTDPYDLYIGSVLYAKMLAITKKYFHIDVISIDSVIGDRINYSIMDPEDCGLELSGNHWWNSDSTYTGSGPIIGWGELEETVLPKFEPKIVKGGKSEN